MQATTSMLTLAALRPRTAAFGLSLVMAACAVGPGPLPRSLGATEFAALSGGAAFAESSAHGGEEPARRARRKYPRGKFLASLGVVDFEHRETDASGRRTLDDETTARIFRLEGERVRRSTGGGASIEVISVNDDLHSNAAGINSSDTKSIDFYAHVTVRPVARMFRMPIRIGPYLNILKQDTDGSDPDDIDYYSLGIRAEIEPEIDLVRTRNHSLSLFFNGHAQAGATTIDYRTRQVDDEFQTSNWGVGIKTGLRVSMRRLHFQLAYLYSRRTFEESDEELVNGNFLTLNEAEFMQDGFMLSMGFRW